MIKTQRRYQEVAARISRYIAERGLEPGSRLPGEIDLAKICDSQKNQDLKSGKLLSTTMDIKVE